MSEIKLENLEKSFDDFVAVEKSDLTIQDNEFFVVLGPSGCGKTTTLRMIAGLELPTSGKILLDNEDVTFLRASQRDIAFVFQLFALYPHMNVKKNLAFPLKMQGYKKSEINKRIEEGSELLRIQHLLNSKVSSLSGGDRQRVALGRAIVRRTKAFLIKVCLQCVITERMINALLGLSKQLKCFMIAKRKQYITITLLLKFMMFLYCIYLNCLIQILR